MDNPNNDEQTPAKDEITSDYANNTLIQPTVWDVKLLFGEFGTTGKQRVDWHTAITMPWAQAKLLGYFLLVQIAAYEQEHGKIKIPDGMVPLSPETLGDAFRENPKTGPVFDIVMELYNRFIKSL